MEGFKIAVLRVDLCHRKSIRRECCQMSTEDKIKNKIEDLGGRAKEALGKATGDHDTKNEGRADQAKSSLKDAGESVKDAFKK